MSGAKLVRLSTDALQKELSFIESPFTTRVEYEKYMLGESAIDVSELAVKQESTTIVAPAAEERAAAVEAEVAAVRAAAEEAARQAAAAHRPRCAERAEAETRECMKVASEQLKQMEAAERLRFNEVKSEAARETHRANKLQEEVNAAREEAKAAKAHAEGILKEAPEAAAKAVEKEAQDEFIEAMVNAGLAHSAWMKEIAAKTRQRHQRLLRLRLTHSTVSTTFSSTGRASRARVITRLITRAPNARAKTRGSTMARGPPTITGMIAATSGTDGMINACYPDALGLWMVARGDTKG